MVYEQHIEYTKGVIEGQTILCLTGKKANGQVMFCKTSHRKLKIKKGKHSYNSK